MDRNLSQEAAIQSIYGPVLLVSCPGSGKTTTMIRRINYMLEKGIPEKNILMVTFTDAAATEMKNKYNEMYGRCSVTFSTIHSLCLKIITMETDVPLRIIEPVEQNAILYDVQYNCGVSFPFEINKDILSDISSYKNSGASIVDFTPASLKKEDFVKVYKEYEKEKAKREYMDFDDLLVRCNELLAYEPDVLKKVQDQYQYIMCDEYQDVNNVQKDILYLMAGERGNLCVVGDDDQSIYGFRGANSQIMEDFKNDFKNCTVIQMDTNYRSGTEIVKSTKRLIENNSKRFKKAIESSKTETGEVVYETFDFRGDELSFVCDEILKKIQDGTPAKEIAILTRTNQAFTDICMLLERNGIDYTSGEPVPDVYEHFIFKDLMSYLKLSGDTFDVADLIQILNRPNRFLKEASFRKVTTYDLPSLQDASDEAGERNYEKIIDLYRQTYELKGKPLKQQVLAILNDAGYRKYIDDFITKTDAKDNFLLDLCDFFIKDSSRFSSYEKWYSYAMAHIKQHKERQLLADDDCVTVSTMHRAKGLEWDCVFIPDCCMGIIPSPQAKSPEEKEEERRLFYVATTRAKESLYILNYTQKKDSKGNIVIVKPSYFIDEINGTIQAEEEKKKAIIKKREEETKRNNALFEEGDPRTLYAGQEVHHETFGHGFVMSITLFALTVRFDSVGTKIFKL